MAYRTIYAPGTPLYQLPFIPLFISPIPSISLIASRLPLGLPDGVYCLHGKQARVGTFRGASYHLIPSFRFTKLSLSPRFHIRRCHYKSYRYRYRHRTNPYIRSYRPLLRTLLLTANPNRTRIRQLLPNRAYKSPPHRNLILIVFGPRDAVPARDESASSQPAPTRTLH